jgi:hypothetical protein
VRPYTASLPPILPRFRGICQGVAEGVGLVGGDGVEGMAEQRLEGGVGVEGVLEVSVGAVGDRVGVGVLGACALGDGFACGGEAFGEGELWEGVVGFGSCGVEGCGVEELLEVVYWVCGVVLPIGLYRSVLCFPLFIPARHIRGRHSVWQARSAPADESATAPHLPPRRLSQPHDSAVPDASPRNRASPCEACGH